MASESKKDFEQTLADYFRTRLAELSEVIDPQPQQDTLWYMGNMLARFGRSKQLFAQEEGQLTIRPLALLYKDAHETHNERMRCLILRQLGDMSLFLGALFPQRFHKKGLQKDYFVGMGGGAYDYLSVNAMHHRHVFSELAQTFTKMLELVARACERESVFDAADILNLYRRWEATGNPLVARQLQALGVQLNLDEEENDNHQDNEDKSVMH